VIYIADFAFSISASLLRKRQETRIFLYP